ncbi:hypothetical protein [Palleronia sp.]
MAGEIVPRLRCRRCGSRGNGTIRHGYKADANAMEGSRLAGDERGQDW